MVTATHHEKKPRSYMRSKNLKRLTRAAIIAAFYFVISVSIPTLSFGAIQFRLSEALCVLPALFPEAILGLTVGCFLANFFSPFGLLDVVLGTTATLISALLTCALHKKLLLSAVPPILLNALIVPLVWVLNKTDMLYWFNMLTILASQAIIIVAIGLPLALGLKKAMPNEVLQNDHKFFRRNKP